MMSTLSENIYHQLRELLGNRHFKPGMRLSQLELAKRFNCSPAPILEALRRLESDGVITKRPNRIACVRELSALEVQALFVVREALEATAARLCAQRITDEQIEQLCRLGEQMVEAVEREDLEASAQLELDIHKFIARCADCPLLLEEIDRMSLVERAAMSYSERRFPLHYRTAHRAIIQAIADREADWADYLMRKHIQGGLPDYITFEAGD